MSHWTLEFKTDLDVNPAILSEAIDVCGEIAQGDSDARINSAPCLVAKTLDQYTSNFMIYGSSAILVDSFKTQLK